MRIEKFRRKPFNEKLDESVLDWIHKRRSKSFRVPRVWQHGMGRRVKWSTDWLRGFMKRYGLPLQRKTSVTQKDTDQLINKLISFVLHVLHLAMKYPYDSYGWNIWADMVSATTLDDIGEKNCK